MDKNYLFIYCLSIFLWNTANYYYKGKASIFPTDISGLRTSFLVSSFHCLGLLVCKVRDLSLQRSKARNFLVNAAWDLTFFLQWRSESGSVLSLLFCNCNFSEFSASRLLLWSSLICLLVFIRQCYGMLCWLSDKFLFVGSEIYSR